MKRANLRNILKSLHQGKITPEEAEEKLRHLPYENLGFARLDHHRELRQGIPEVIFCEGKTEEQNVEIIQKMRSAGQDVLATRCTEGLYNRVKKKNKQAIFNQLAKTITIGDCRKSKVGKIVVATAGTSDIPVAEEASVTAEAMGSQTERVYDVGVAGIHRIMDKRDLLLSANVIIVAAGMDGALPSVVGGLVKVPVIAVPTSIGYGASFQGLSALLAMLNSCASGVGVVNIDNGFGAGVLAHKINFQSREK
ncbi:MAG: nickel pincer cofactor biosynthesis protein LarB [Nitrospinota bacterium]